MIFKKTILTFTALAVASTVSAQPLTALSITMLNRSYAASKQLSAKEIRERLQLNADIYLMDSGGKKILAGPERTNYWRPNRKTGTIEGDWSSKFEAGLIALRYSWIVADDGSMKFSIEEYAGSSDKSEFKDLLDKKELAVENFEPVVWKVKNIKSQNFIVRFVPTLREVSTPISVDNLPIAGKGISISDSTGYLWAEDVEFNGRYSGVTSHRGTLVLSYVPFSGGKELGFAEGKLITLTVDKEMQIFLRGTSDFLPAGVTAKVYAAYLPEKKSKSFSSLHSYDTSREDRIKDVLRK